MNHYHFYYKFLLFNVDYEFEDNLTLITIYKIKISEHGNFTPVNIYRIETDNRIKFDLICKRVYKFKNVIYILYNKLGGKNK